MPIQFKMRGGIPNAAAREKAHRIVGEMHLPLFVAETLVARGLDSTEAVELFTNPSLERDWHNPYDIEGMSWAVDQLEDAVKARKHIVVFGDFDLDGISATTVMVRGIRALGGKATPFIPRRFDEGYGLSEAATNRVKKLDPDLIVTVDCGISCRDEVSTLMDAGLSVIVTDHHEAPAHLPVGVPVVDPKAQSGSPSAILAGVGVALKVVQALGGRMGFPYLWRSYTDFATLGTVADLMPMLDENRSLVVDGLRMMNEDPRPCIAALISASGMSGKELTASNLSFSLVPRLNAAGRMGNADLALDLLMSDSYEEACVFAQQLEGLNDLRRKTESELSKLAHDEAEKTYAGERALVVAGAGWHEGVKGIVASRLVNAYGVPALLFTVEDGQARGSGRSVGNVNLFKAIEATQDLLTRFGGHGAAVGVTLPASNLDAFRKRLCDYMAKLPEAEFKPMVEVDAIVELEELTLDNVAKLSMLAPFGQENPDPVFLACNVVLDQCRAVGAEKNHFSCKLTDGRVSVGGILFHCADIDHLLHSESTVNAAFTVQIDEWRGVQSVKAMLKAVAPSQSCGALQACLDRDACTFVDGLFACGNEICGTCENPLRRSPGLQSEHAQKGHAGTTGREEQDPASLRAKWHEIAVRDPKALEREVIRAIIGERTVHATQRRMLDMLDEGVSVLGVMATGRGKSLVFQVHAALEAIARSKASIFVYPLRALMSDQAFHLSEQLSRFGLECRVLNGETPQDERERIYSGLVSGAVDVILTTPEYLQIHVDRIAACRRVGFLVVDEAHHIGQAKAGLRPSYRKLASVVHALGNPVVLAVTATASDAIANDIALTLPIIDSVVDDTPRDNLDVDDQRGIKNRDDYLAHIVATGDKCVVYVNSRDQSVGVARRLRARVPQLAPMIGFYNAGLSREERRRVEDLFRKGDICVLVATSAFGEGIDIPDIRHVVLYHMPFSEVEFNQMSGRAGRDGRRSWIHLLYGKQDVAINRGILEDMTPARDVMALIYRTLRTLQRARVQECLTLGMQELADLVSEGARHVSVQATACGITVFTELGLIESEVTYKAGTEAQRIRVIEDAAKVELTDSVRYREGVDEIESFLDFRDWAMKCDLAGLVARLRHPIVPHGRIASEGETGRNK